MLEERTRTAYRILNPTSVIAEVERVERPPIVSLNGASLGVLSNGIGEGHGLPGAVADHLITRFEFADVVRHVKPTISRPAEPAVLDDLAARVDVALVGTCA